MGLAQNWRLENTFQVFCKIIHLVVFISHFWKVLLLKIPQNVLHFIQTLLKRPRWLFFRLCQKPSWFHEWTWWLLRHSQTRGHFPEYKRHTLSLYCIFCITKRKLHTFIIKEYCIFWIIKRIYVTFLSCTMHRTLFLLSRNPARARELVLIRHPSLVIRCHE